jgi:Ca2+-binding EF-hand superfamily protein
LFRISRRLTAEKLKLTDDQHEAALELEKLQSVSKSAAERFADEGIGSILELAYSDPIDLSMRTNFNFNYVRDCVSQALFWIYFPEQKLQYVALRGTMEVGNLVRDHEDYHRDQCGMNIPPKKVDDDSCYRPAGAVDDQPPAASKKYDHDLQKRRHDETQHVIDDVAKQLKISSDALMATLRQVAYDPYTRFLRKMWKDMAERQKDMKTGEDTLLNTPATGAKKAAA